MKTDNHNDWTDAFRESFLQEARPEDGGWEAVAGRMRRAAARRRAAVAAAVLALPVAGGLLFHSPHVDSPVPGMEVADAPGLLAEAPAPAPAAVAADILREMPEGSARNAGILREMPEGSALTDGIIREMPEDSAQNDGILQEMPEDSAQNDGILREMPEDSAQNDGILREEGAPRRRVSVGINAGSTAVGASTTLTTTAMAGSISTKSGNFIWNNSSGVILQHEYIHDLPMSLGLSARYGLNDRISIETGLDFTRLHSKLDGMHSVMLFAGIPLRMDVRLFQAGPAEIYAGAGGEAEKCLRATFGGMKYSEPKIQWSGSAFLGAQVRIAGNAWFYLQPQLSYYFTKTTLTSYRSENRLGITVNAGLRFDLTGTR